MLTVNQELSGNQPDIGQLQIVIESDTLEELLGPEALQLAIKEAAAKGLHAPVISHGASPYPVDPRTDAPLESPVADMPITKYRIEYKIQARLY